jgi:hypothetical protein
MKGFRMTVAAGLAAAIALGSQAARADEQSGVSVGVRTGYGIPVGAAKSGLSLGDYAGGMIPFWFDLGYRLDPHWYVGVYFQFGLTFPPNHSCPQASCDGSDLRGGINVTYNFMPSQKVDPWLGIGTSYEVNRVYVEDESQTETSQIYHGFDYLNIEGGIDLRFVKHLPFGPFFDFSLGQYSYERLNNDNAMSSDIPTTSKMHEWLDLGLRARFDM